MEKMLLSVQFNYTMDLDTHVDDIDKKTLTNIFVNTKIL
jgi:hypothetical protein